MNLWRNIILFNALLEFYKDQNCKCLVLISNCIACIIDCKPFHANFLIKINWNKLDESKADQINRNSLLKYPDFNAFSENV